MTGWWLIKGRVQKNKKKIIEFSIKGWLGLSGWGQILLKKIKKKQAFKVKKVKKNF